MNCLAIDDEPLALNVIEGFCSKIDFLSLKGKCTSAFDAIKIINKQTIDLIFIDIQMPDITGLDFIKTLTSPPMIIFTTAYSEYALQGYELNTVDYLVKPIPFDRFLKAVNKAYELYNLRQTNTAQESISIRKSEVNSAKSNQNTKEFLLIKVEYSTVRVDLDDILYIEGLKDYIKIFTREKMLLTKSTMKNIDSKLPSDMFIRVHKSYIVSFKNIRKIENNRIIIGEKYIPIGEQFKTEFYNYVNKNRL